MGDLLMGLLAGLVVVLGVAGLVMGLYRRGGDR